MANYTQKYAEKKYKWSGTLVKSQAGVRKKSGIFGSVKLWQPWNKTNKKELHNQLDEFYRCTKVKAHFQDTHKKADLSEEEYRLKAKTINVVFLQKHTIQWTH